MACELDSKMDQSDSSRFARIDAESRKVPPLSHVLFLFAVATCPVWISAAIAITAEFMRVSPLDYFYAVLHGIAAVGLAVSVVVTGVVATRATRRRLKSAEVAATRSDFQLGWGAASAAWNIWWSLLFTILVILYFITAPEIDEFIIGFDRKELSNAGRFWLLVARTAVFTAFFSCFLGFCKWHGYRLQKQRAAQ